MKQYIVNAFSRRRGGGNPAAVCLLGDHWLQDSYMREIAQENNFSETAFLISCKNGYFLRWFTPVAEINFCGHATIAAAFVVGNFINARKKEIVFHTRAGDLMAQVDGNLVTMDFPAYTWKEIPVTEAMTEAIGVTPQRAVLSRDLLMVLESPEDVKNLEPNMAKLAQLPGLTKAVTACEPKIILHDCISRVFAPELGCPEDPVTGSTHCLIAPYWSQRLKKSNILAYQASPRGGILRCAVHGDRVKMEADAFLYSEADIYPGGFNLKEKKEIVTVWIEPDKTPREMPRPKTAAQLLTALGLMEETALVIRDGELLTPDRQIWPEDKITVRVVSSRG